MSPEEVYRQILDSAEESKEDGYVLRVVMDLPSLRDVPVETLADALEMVLAHYRIEMPPEIHQSIKEGRSQDVSFFAPGLQKELRPRNVSINASPEIRTLSIQGEPALNGMDGCVELFFDYKIRSGRLRPDGTIDFREINRFPQAGEGELLLREYEPTKGILGTDVHGMPIAPEPGKKFPIRCGKGVIVEESVDEDKERKCKDYLAQKPGIIITEFAEGKRDPDHLREIAVQNRLVVGDVDFSTGNIGREEEIRCAADVVINGDIRGNFSVVVDGQLEVKGAVEGEGVDVTGALVASFIRSSVKAGTTIQVRTARCAKLRAESNIIVEKEITQCEVSADFFELRPKGTPEVLIGNVFVSARQVLMDRASIRNLVEVRLGEDLFEFLYHIEQQEAALKKDFERVGATLKDRISVFTARLKTTLSAWGETVQKELGILRLLVAKLLKGEITCAGGRERISEWMKAVPEGLHPVGKKAARIFEVKEEEQNLLKLKEELAKQKKEVMEEISRIGVKVRGNLAGTGTLVVRCSDIEYKYLSDPKMPKKNLDINLAYTPGKGLEEMSEG